jgi:hypothetical protein
MERDPDFSDELIADRTAKNHKFPQLVAKAAKRRRQAKVAAYQELAKDDERLEIIKRSSRAAVDAGIW